MKGDLEYRGVWGSVSFSEEDGVFHGRIQHTSDLVTYEAGDAEGLQQAFREAVDDYLELCARRDAAG